MNPRVIRFHRRRRIFYYYYYNDAVTYSCVINFFNLNVNPRGLDLATTILYIDDGDETYIIVCQKKKKEDIHNVYNE